MTRRSPLRKAGATTADGAAGKMTGATEKSLDNPYTYVITSAMLARQVTLPRRIHSANSFVRMPLPPLGFSCLSFTSSRRLFSIACSLFVQNRGVGIPLSAPSRRRAPINSFASYYIRVTPCSFTRLRALLRNGDDPNHCLSRGYALFLSRRGWYPPMSGRCPLRKAGATTAESSTLSGDLLAVGPSRQARRCGQAEARRHFSGLRWGRR